MENENYHIDPSSIEGFKARNEELDRGFNATASENEPVPTASLREVGTGGLGSKRHLKVIRRGAPVPPIMPEDVPAFEDDKPEEEEEEQYEAPVIDTKEFADKARASIEENYDDDEQAQEHEEKVTLGSQLRNAFAELVNRFKRPSDDEEDEEEEELRVEEVEELDKKDKQTLKKALIIIGSLSLAALVFFIGKKQIDKMLAEYKDANLDNTTTSQTVGPEVTPAPTDAPQTEESVQEQQTLDPDVISKEIYDELLNKETDKIRFNLPDGEETIKNMVYTLNPSLGKTSNIDIGDASSILNEIAENNLVFDLNIDLSKFLYTYDEEMVNLLSDINKKALSLGKENLTIDVEALGYQGIYTEEQIANIESAGANPSDDKEFMSALENITSKYPETDVNNLLLYVYLDAIYNQCFEAEKTVNYLTHYEDGAKRDLAFRKKEDVIFSDEMLNTFASQNAPVEDKVSDEVVTTNNNEYYTLLTQYESLYGIKFQKIDSNETINQLGRYANAKEEMNPKEFYETLKSIVETSKEAGINPRLDILFENSKYANLIAGAYNRLATLKIDREYFDDKEVAKYYAESLLDNNTSIVNIQDPEQIPVFMAMVALYDGYEDELHSYVIDGKNGEFDVNGEPYFSCAMGIRDDLWARRDNIILTYETNETLNRSR